MSVTDEEKKVPSGTVASERGVARELAASGALDGLFEQVESGKVGAYWC